MDKIEKRAAYKIVRTRLLRGKLGDFFCVRDKEGEENSV